MGLMNVRRVLIAMVLFAMSWDAKAACVGTPTHICVSHNGFVFEVNGVARGALNFQVGTTYEFEMTASVSSFHPFILTTSSTGGFGSTPLGASAGVQGPNPANMPGQIIQFTPVNAGTVFYQCSSHAGMGAAINVTAALPSISGLSDLVIHQNTSTGPLPFTVGDATTAASNLTLTALSTNTALIPTNQILFGGDNSNRTATVTPSTNQSGQSRISVIVSNPGGGKATNSFVITVVPLALEILSAGPQSNVLQFIGLSNRTYSLERSDSLSAGPWEGTAVPSPLTNGPVRLTNSVNDIPIRFYRLATPFSP
jgi:hypothetical protein